MPGFTPTKSSSENSQPLAQPETTSAKNGGSSGVLLTECSLVNDVQFYGCILSEGAALPNLQMDATGKLSLGTGITNHVVIDLTRNRKKTFVNLTPDTRYHFSFYAANAAGMSQLTPVISRIAV